MNLISSDQLSKDQINRIMDIADSLKSNKEEIAIKEHSILALFFEEPSTRTRVSLEVAMTQLGGHAIYLDAQETQAKRGETIEDISKVVSGYCDFIAARMRKHKDLVRFADNSTVPVINALTELEHPTQALADVYTIKEYKNGLKGVKIAFVGDITTNTANSLMLTASKLGADISLVGPKDLAPNMVYFNRAREYGKVKVFSDISEGVEDADVIYTDTFVSMGKEGEAEERERIFAPYQVNNAMLEYAKPEAVVMHCLPAHRGREITADVIDGPKSIVFRQAKNKLLINKAILLYISQRE